MARAWPLKGTVPVRPVLGNEPVQSIKGPLISQPLPAGSTVPRASAPWDRITQRQVCGQDTGSPRGLTFPALLCLSLLVVFVFLSFSSVSGPEEVFLVPLLHFLDFFIRLWEEG